MQYPKYDSTVHIKCTSLSIFQLTVETNIATDESKFSTTIGDEQ
jgi:pyrroloquinoline quinone (PQQ) biosynthesis protein C